MSDESFRAVPDPELGPLLAEALDAGLDEGAAVARLRRAIALEPREDGLEVLARWARPGLVAAAALLLAVSAWLARTAPQPVAVADAIVPHDAPAGLFAAEQPDRDVVLSAALNGR